MTDKILILIGALGGSVIGGFTALFGAWLKEKYETKRHVRKLIIEAAITEWSKLVELSKSTGKSLMPLDNYITHHVLVLESILEGSTSPEDIRKTLAKSSEITKIYLEKDKDWKKNAS